MWRHSSTYEYDEEQKLWLIPSGRTSAFYARMIVTAGCNTCSYTVFWYQPGLLGGWRCEMCGRMDNNADARTERMIARYKYVPGAPLHEA